MPPRSCMRSGDMPTASIHCREKTLYLTPPKPKLANGPFPGAQPYAEQGPIFLPAESCRRPPDSEDVPAMFRERKDYLIRGYSADDRIVYGTGKIVAPAAMAEAAREMFGNARVAYIHVRSASNNCYQARI